MKKTPSRRPSTERRKTPRSTTRVSAAAAVAAKPEVSEPGSELHSGLQNESGCANCAKAMGPGDRALFVEEEVGRTFCSEECIGEHFSLDVERLDSEFQNLLSPSDLNEKQREDLSHLRWNTLKEPDEVWREKTLSGDYRYTMISQFELETRQVWCICISLFLRGEPSFLYLSAVSRNAAIAEHYRRGERVSWVKRNSAAKSIKITPEFSTEQQALDGTVIPGSDPDLMEAAGFKVEPADGLALDGWSTEEALRASVNTERGENDIPEEQFAAYQSCIEETLQGPNELWSMEAVTEDEEVRLYHFIKHYPQGGAADDTGFWYLIIAREVPASEAEEEHLEVLDAFPTRDVDLVARYRVGSQELESGPAAEAPATRVLH